MPRPLNPTTIHPPFARYVHGVEVSPAARLVACSGQLGIDAAGTIPAAAFDQAVLCFKSIEAILKEAGMGLEDIIKLTAYVTDRAHVQSYMAARDSLLSGPPPASTLVVITGFTRPEFLVEVEALAAKED